MYKLIALLFVTLLCGSVQALDGSDFSAVDVAQAPTQSYFISYELPPSDLLVVRQDFNSTPPRPAPPPEPVKPSPVLPPKQPEKQIPVQAPQSCVDGSCGNQTVTYSYGPARQGWFSGNGPIRAGIERRQSRRAERGGIFGGFFRGGIRGRRGGC